MACGAAHTLVLSMDGLTVWSFGSGDLGKLGHGDTNRQTLPKVSILTLCGISRGPGIAVFSIVAYMYMISVWQYGIEVISLSN